jgi:glycosyltransferase involved in cell wall biosynthesis
LEQKTLSALKNNKNIICVGFQSDVRQYYAISDCLVFPSYREGFPNVVMQAGAMGLPSIVTDINGCNEIIIDGINGVLVPSKNEESLMKAMLNMYEMVSLRNSLKMNARKSIVSRYNQKDIWNLILKEYEELISGS